MIGKDRKRKREKKERIRRSRRGDDGRDRRSSACKLRLKVVENRRAGARVHDEISEPSDIYGSFPWGGYSSFRVVVRSVF